MMLSGAFTLRSVPQSKFVSYRILAVLDFTVDFCRAFLYSVLSGVTISYGVSRIDSRGKLTIVVI